MKVFFVFVKTSILFNAKINPRFFKVLHKTENLRSKDKILSKLWVGFIRSEGTVVVLLYKCPRCSILE